MFICCATLVSGQRFKDRDNPQAGLLSSSLTVGRWRVNNNSSGRVEKMGLRRMVDRFGLNSIESVPPIGSDPGLPEVDGDSVVNTCESRPSTLARLKPDFRVCTCPANLKLDAGDPDSHANTNHQRNSNHLPSFTGRLYLW